jgi:hypothetical protein
MESAQQVRPHHDKVWLLGGFAAIRAESLWLSDCRVTFVRRLRLGGIAATI